MAQDKKNFWDAYGLANAVPLAVAKALCAQAFTMPRGTLIPFLISATAQGKTAAVNAVARQHGYKVVRMSMIGMEPTDLTGLPFFDKDGDTFHYVRDGRIPVGDDPAKVVLFLDEVNRVEQHTINALFQLLDGWLGGYRIGENVRVILAANPADGGYAVASQVTSDPALLRRCVVIPVVRGPEELLAYARDPSLHGGTDAPWHPVLLNFLAANMGYIHDEAGEEGGEIFATAGGWERVSALVYSLEKQREAVIKDKELSEIDVSHRLAVIEAAFDAAVMGSVGGDAGVKFQDYYRNQEAQLDPKNILEMVPGDRAYEAIQKISSEGRDNQLSDTMRGLADYIAVHKPPADKVADSLAHLYTLVHEHTWGAFTDQLREYTKAAQYTNGGYNTRYMTQLLGAALHSKIAVTHIARNAPAMAATNRELNSMPS
jgi:hypothetical protein